LATPAVQADIGMVIADHINPLSSGGVCDLSKYSLRKAAKIELVNRA
jgi:hypothetical protein